MIASQKEELEKNKCFFVFKSTNYILRSSNSHNKTFSLVKPPWPSRAYHSRYTNHAHLFLTHGGDYHNSLSLLGQGARSTFSFKIFLHTLVDIGYTFFEKAIWMNISLFIAVHMYTLSTTKGQSIDRIIVAYSLFYCKPEILLNKHEQIGKGVYSWYHQSLPILSFDTGLGKKKVLHLCRIITQIWFIRDVCYSKIYSYNGPLKVDERQICIYQHYPTSVPVI